MTFFAFGCGLFILYTFFQISCVFTYAVMVSFYLPPPYLEVSSSSSLEHFCIRNIDRVVIILLLIAVHSFHLDASQIFVRQQDLGSSVGESASKQGKIINCQWLILSVNIHMRNLYKNWARSHMFIQIHGRRK